MVLGCRDPYFIVLDGGDPYSSISAFILFAMILQQRTTD